MVEVCIIDSEDVPRPYCIDCSVHKRNGALSSNYYSTTEPRFALERDKVMEELKRFTYDFHHKSMTLKFYIRYDFRTQKIFIQGTHNWLGPIVYFKSPQDAQNAIKFIGVNRLLKYYFKCPCDEN